jgi:diguanylate cyclase (GGDEF)-like protein
VIQQTVLIIDDAEEVHALLDVRLRGEALRLYHAESPERGLDMAVELQPDLILLDVDMPQLSGFEVCQRLKADPSTAHIPVVFLTGSGDITTKVRGFDLGAVDYVTKPFDPVELRARVRSTLRTKRYLDLLSARAQVDGLTGLKNRAYFEQRISEEVAAAMRYGREVCLVMVDVDHFKNLNDSFGHPFGDLVLQRIGELLTGCSRVTDAACRFGGEEFALVLTETDSDGAMVLAERLRQEIKALAFTSRGQNVSVTASFGVCSARALLEAKKLDVRTLVEAADHALYSAKRSGRDQVALASPSNVNRTVQ